MLDVDANSQENGMKVELPGQSKSFGAINPGECFAFSHHSVTSIGMKVEWLGAAGIAVLWSASADWTVPQLIDPRALAGSRIQSLPSAVFVASADPMDIRVGASREDYAPGFLIKTPDGQMLIAVKSLEGKHGTSVIDVEAGKSDGVNCDNLTLFMSWRIASKVLDKYETVCSFPNQRGSHKPYAPR
jgi:hypothetical protein